MRLGKFPCFSDPDSSSRQRGGGRGECHRREGDSVLAFGVVILGGEEGGQAIWTVAVHGVRARMIVAW
jgi:hypothetical protein